MDGQLRCKECGALLVEGGTCFDHFYQMLAWENEKPANGEVHNLTVLCYYLQHPGLYSPAGLDYAMSLLVDFLDKGLSPQEVRRINQHPVSSSQRKFKITATPESFGAYARPVHWRLTAADVTAGTLDTYLEKVRGWAQATLDELKSSGNIREGQ
jgi:hypothetical protein